MERNIFPEINLGIVDKAKELGKKAIGLCSYYPPDAGGYPSDYPKHPERGAAAMLDRALDEPSDGEAMIGYAEIADGLAEQLEKARAVEHYTNLAEESQQLKFGWDSCGNYFEGDGAL